jgi:hypothetical protein
VRIEQLESPDAFIVYDLEGADRSAGVARVAPKVLHESAEMLARVITYAAATFELRVSGASAGINAKPDQRNEAIGAFVDQVTPRAADGALLLWAGTGLTDDDLAPLGTEPLDQSLMARGAVAAAEAALGSLEGKSATVVGSGAIAERANDVLADRGVTVQDGGLESAVDAIFVEGKAGIVDHHVAAAMKAKVVVPLSWLPVTAKAYAALRRAEVVYVPDFVALAAPLLALLDSDSPADPVERVAESMRAIEPADPGAWLLAIGRAEAFLSTWQDALPFGRPLA